MNFPVKDFMNKKNNNVDAMSVFSKWVDEYLNFERTPVKNIFWLDTMFYLCKKFSNPQDSFKSFHVAGSKGKGSVSVMIASILEAAGFPSGLYTSPHLINFSERIGTVKGNLSEAVYEKSVSSVMNGVNSILDDELPAKRPVTWFELVTLLSFVCFKNAGFQYAVYETGLGGRLDATNVLSPVCCCINTIELEHTEFLGNTLEKIAFEKAGIIKPGVPVIVAPQKESVKEVFRKAAEEKNAPVFFADECGFVKINDFSFDGMKICLTSNLFSRPLNVKLKLLGDFQATNALIASIAVKTVLPDIREDIIEEGLSNASLSGRFEIIKSPDAYKNLPYLILDGAHTVNSIQDTLSNLNKVFPSNKNFHLLFACAYDKNVESISSLFKNKFSHIILTKPGDVKECDIERCKNAFDENELHYISCSDYYRAISLALHDADEENAVLLVTGSFYLVAEVKKYLLSKLCVSN